MSEFVLLGDCRSQGCRDWVRAGRPYTQSKPTAALKATGDRHGWIVYGYPDKSHLVAARPEDHTPFSATGAPTPAPRWIGNAVDIMPRGGSAADKAELARLARQIIADKDAGVPGTDWIKYLNWTDEQGNCWHVSWESGHKVVTRSADRDHIHVSGRSDKVNEVPAPWDPWDRMNHGGTGEDDDMGATYMDGQIPDTAKGPYNINVGIVEGGAADPRAAWLSFTNDTITGTYALRLMWTTGDNVYQPLQLVGADFFGNEGSLLHKGVRAWVQLPDNCVSISVLRQAVKDGKPVDPAIGGKPYDGPIGFAIERGAVGSK
jgi:hypothetical protein